MHQQENSRIRKVTQTEHCQSPSGLAGYSAFRKSVEGSFMRDAVSAMSQAAHRDKARGGRERCRGAGRALGCFRSWLILARMVPADAPGVLLDGRQGGIKGYEGALLDAGHGLPSM